MMTGFVEIRIRRFFTADEGDVTPSVTILMDSEDIPSPENFLRKLSERAVEDLKGIPVTNLREMTEQEVKDMIAEEDDD